MDNHIREAIESCRAGSDDLQSPEMADAARQVEQDAQVRQVHELIGAWDRAIGQAMHQISVPAGLAEKLLAQLAENDSATAPGAIAAAAVEGIPADAQVTPAPAASQLAWPRRRWLLTVSSGVAAAIVAVVAVQWFNSPGELTLEDLAAEWSQELRPHWQAMGAAPVAEYPVPASLVVPPSRFQKIRQLPAAAVVAYELVHPKAGAAVLYVAKINRSGLPSSPPPAPQSTTGGKAIGYWQSGNRVYVLVVPGDERSYRAFVRSSVSPLA